MVQFFWSYCKRHTLSVGRPLDMGFIKNVCPESWFKRLSKVSIRIKSPCVSCMIVGFAQFFYKTVTFFLALRHVGTPLQLAM